MLRFFSRSFLTDTRDNQTKQVRPITEIAANYIHLTIAILNFAVWLHLALPATLASTLASCSQMTTLFSISLEMSEGTLNVIILFLFLVISHHIFNTHGPLRWGPLLMALLMALPPAEGYDLDLKSQGACAMSGLKLSFNGLFGPQQHRSSLLHRTWLRI